MSANRAISEAIARREIPSITDIFTIVSRLPKVYPGYIAMRIKKALRLADPEGIITGVDDVETIGDCRYAIRAHDADGNTYKITVEVERERGAA